MMTEAQQKAWSESQKYARRRAEYIGMHDWEDLATETFMIVNADKRLETMSPALIVNRVKEVVNREVAKMTKTDREARSANKYTRRPDRIAGYNDTKLLASGADVVHSMSPVEFIDDVVEGATFDGHDMLRCDDPLVMDSWMELDEVRRRRIYEKVVEGVVHPKSSPERRNANRALSEFVDLVNSRADIAVSIDALTDAGVDIPWVPSD
ncbi:hypothetical protein [Brevibacterium yomogidense]|uniref:hypothetical protein n=1 Tax=Brevibacterium yomogidense TaxID=946573 RepID=UPI0018E04247|nr:hypothetical protein [Brevibacterium yomogidense]